MFEQFNKTNETLNKLLPRELPKNCLYTSDFLHLKQYKSIANKVKTTNMKKLVLI